MALALILTLSRRVTQPAIFHRVKLAWMAKVKS